MFLSSHLSVNSPQKVLNLWPLDKISLKNSFFAKIFRDIFSKVQPARRQRPAAKSAGGPQNRRFATGPLK